MGHAVKHVPFHLKLHSSRAEKSARIILKHRLSGEASNEQKDGECRCFFLDSFLSTGLCLYAQEAVDIQQVIAEVGGQKLTLGDLQQQQGGKLLQAKYQYYMNQRKALDQLINDKLIEIEAKNRHLSSDQLLNTVVYKDLKDPTEDQLQVYYEGMESNESYEAIHDHVLEHIRELRREKARAAYVTQLRSNASVQVLLAPPFAEVDLKDAYPVWHQESPGDAG